MTGIKAQEAGAARDLFAGQEAAAPARRPSAPAAAGAATPMMAQYLQIKREHPGCLLFYRMGDFYELFFDDAKTAAAALDIALTRRGRHLGRAVPMCGVPVHAADSYMQKLIRAGHRVAVCEQMEQPDAARRGPLRRAVVRVVTSGTVTEEALLPARAHNYLAALAPPAAGAQLWGLAWADISTGDFYARPAGAQDLAAELARLSPGELLLPETLAADLPDWLAPFLDSAPHTGLPARAFESGKAALRLREALGVADLAAFGDFPAQVQAACGALLDYVQLTQAGAAPRLKPPRLEAPGRTMQINAAAYAGLELIRSSSGQRHGSLLWAIDRTVTGPGGRLLAERLCAPLTDPEEIGARQDGLAFFLEREELRAKTRAGLRAAPDMARALQRLALGRGGPLDLAALRDGLAAAGALAQLLDAAGADQAGGVIARALADLRREHDRLAEKLSAALIAAPPLLAREGGFIAAGFDSALDRHRQQAGTARREIAALQARYIRETGLRALKVKHNGVLGYHIEVPAAAGARLLEPPLSERFIHRQTLASQMRFTTAPLAGKASEVLRAGARALARELEIFADLTAAVEAQAPTLFAAARALAELDVCAGLAQIAAQRDFTRPRLDRSLRFQIEGGRHPVVEAALDPAAGRSFTANDCRLDAAAGDAARLWLVTGPNMAGKSTFLRQNALIAILAQMGSFVPARRARIGIIDRLFSRIGASDKLSRGQSTFMVEMVETAAILNQAGRRAFVVIDEIGRGTATFDGLSLAWAVVEHMHSAIGARALFATHFHELTRLEEKLPGLANMSMRIEEHDGAVIFLHEVAAGAADRSYGVQVARLAGLPGAVLARAADLLAALESGESPRAAPPPPRAAPRSEAEAVLRQTDPDALSPRQAHDLLYRLRRLVR